MAYGQGDPCVNRARTLLDRGIQRDLRRFAFVRRVLTAREPIVDLTTFADRNFGIGCLIALFIGVGLYGLTYMYPRYLAEVRGCSAPMIGETMFVSGITMFLVAPIIGRLRGIDQGIAVDTWLHASSGLCRAP